MAWDCLPINTAFSGHTLWQKAGYFQVTPIKVLQRTVNFNILLVTDDEGVAIKLKVDRTLLPLFHTAYPSVIMFWYECGKLRFGCQRPLQAFSEDAFLAYDQSKIPRSTWDPTYRPLQEGFEPWAQNFESSELCAGYGLVSETDELHEPWMVGRFSTSDAFEANPPRLNEVQTSQPQLSPSSKAVVSSVTLDFEGDEYHEPWMYTHVSPARSEGHQQIQLFTDDYPEWFIIPSALSSTSTGQVYQTGCPNKRAGSFDTSRKAEMSDANLQSQGCQSGPYRFFRSNTSCSSQASHDAHGYTVECTPPDATASTRRNHFRFNDPSAGQTCFSGLYHMISRGLKGQCFSFASQGQKSYHATNSCKDSSFTPPMAPTEDLLPNDTKNDFVKLFWDQESEALPIPGPHFLNIFDLHHFCRRHHISCTKYGHERSRSTIDRPLVKGRKNCSSQLWPLSQNRQLWSPTRPFAINQCTDNTLGCVPTVPPYPEWPKGEPILDTRDVPIPPQVCFQPIRPSSSSQRGRTSTKHKHVLQQSKSSMFESFMTLPDHPLVDKTDPCPILIHPDRLSRSMQVRVERPFSRNLDKGQTSHFSSASDEGCPAVQSSCPYQDDNDIPFGCSFRESYGKVANTSYPTVSRSAGVSRPPVNIRPPSHVWHSGKTEMPITAKTELCVQTTQHNECESVKVMIFNLRAHRAWMTALTTQMDRRQYLPQTTTYHGAVPDYHPYILTNSASLPSFCILPLIDSFADFGQNQDFSISILQRLQQVDTICHGAVPISNHSLRTDVLAFREHYTRSLHPAILWPSDTIPIMCEDLQMPTPSFNILEDFSSFEEPKMKLQFPLQCTTVGGAVSVSNHSKTQDYDQLMRDGPFSQGLFSHHVVVNASPSGLHSKKVTTEDVSYSNKIQDQILLWLQRADTTFDGAVPIFNKDLQTKYLTVCDHYTQRTHPAISWPYDTVSTLQEEFRSCFRHFPDFEANQVITIPFETTQLPRLFTTCSGTVPNRDHNQTYASDRCSIRDYLQQGPSRHPLLIDVSTSSFESTAMMAGAHLQDIRLHEVYSCAPLKGVRQQLLQPDHRNIDEMSTMARPSQLALIVPGIGDLLTCLKPSALFTSSVETLKATEELDCVKGNANFQGWSQAVYTGGHPAWGRCQVIHMAPNPPFAERCAAALQDNGWLASDEALWFLRKLKVWRTDIAICPIIQWSPSRDLRHLIATEDQLQFTNHKLNILLFLVEAHWCAVEVDRRTEPVHVVIIQWPSEHHTLVVLEISRILQIPPTHMLVTYDNQNEIMTMCGWTILFRWYNSFAMNTCLQPMIHVADQHQTHFDRVILRSQQHWNRTNATPDLLQFAVECRRAFMSEYASNQPDSRLPPGVDTVMFVGPQDDYVQEICQVSRPPTDREREINYLRTMLIQPAWMTNFEVELVLRAVRMQVLDRYLPSPLHFDEAKECLESLSTDLPSMAGYTKILLFITFNYHWISISGLKHQHRWMLTAAVPDPESPHLAPLFRAVATLLETSPDRIHVQATTMQSHQHLCGWVLLHSLQAHCEVVLQHDTTVLLQRIAVMPNSRIKNLVFEEALSTWTKYAPNQDVVTFATQVRAFLLAHMDMWGPQTVIHFGGMFPPPPMTPARASWNTVSLSTKARILQKIRAHVQRLYVCPCIQRVTAYIIIDRILEPEADFALFGAFIKPSPLKWATHFCGERVSHAICQHEQITAVVLRVPKRYADLIPLRVEAIVYQGKVQVTTSQAVISILDLESGLRIFRAGRNHPTTNFDVGEFCAGAFSGWTQATKILETLGYTTTTKFAIDQDPCVATWYSRNFTDNAMAAKPEDMFHLRDECFHYRELPVIFQTDLALGWYLIFCEPIDIATASPPCPAFSSASTAAGLEKTEGQVIIDTLLKMMLLQPKVFVLEEVANLRTHAHFPLVLELLNWGNFQVAWQEVLNLEEWLPQSRPRLILIAIRRCAYGLKHFACQPWPSNPAGPTSLQNCHCLLRDTTTIELMSAPLDCDIAKLYFDPSKVPGAVPRTFQDAVRFRLRTEQDRVQCLMTSYAFGHEFDAMSTTPKGIFGNLIRQSGRIRFLAGPELLWLQGLSVPWKGPINPRLLNHIVGNAISVPHALVGLLNALCHFSHLELDTFPHEVFQAAMHSRLHAVNSDCLVDPDTSTFAIVPKQVPVTAPWDMWEEFHPSLTRVDFLQGNRQRSIYVQPGLPILSVFHFLFKSYSLEHVLWLPFDRLGLALPLVDTDTFCGTRMMFSLPESYRLCIQEQSFQDMATEWTIILLPDRMVICRVNSSTMIADLTSIVSHERTTPYQLCNHMLKRWNSTARPPQVTTACRVEAFTPYVERHFQGAFIDMGEWLQARLPTEQTTEFLQTCHGSGLTDFLWALGWKIFCLQDPDSESWHQSIMILPTCSQLFVDVVAVRNILAAHITTWYIPPTSEPTTNTVRLSLKLWATVIWEGNLPITTKTDVFSVAWHAASAFLGPQIQVRSILRGKRLSPEETFAGYIVQEEKESSLNRVHLIGVLSGGGSKTDLALRTNQALTDFLLQSGASSIQTPQFVKDVLMLAGVTRLQQVLAMRDPEMKLEQIKQTALHFNIPLPDFADFEADTHKRIRKFAARRSSQTTTHKAADFRLPNHLFHDAHGEPIPQSTDRTKSQGVFLIDASEAFDFQQHHQSASSPCVMVVLGPTCPLQSKSCHPCNLPATDANDAKVVVAACTHILGTAKATLRGADQEDITTEPTSVIAFTAWRSELAESVWEQLCEGPLKTIWKIFSIDPTKNVVNKPWGRSWRCNNQAVEPEQAESFQVHVRLYTSKIPTVLAQSGCQGIFVNPKTMDGNMLDPSFAVVWLRDHDHSQALAAAKKIPEHAGLVVSFRGKKGYGLRVPSTVYEEAQTILTPSLPKQPHIPAHCFVKLSPLPHGVTAEDIRNWLEKQALRMRPVRSLAPNTWLLAASDKMEACHYLWGKSTVLIAPVIPATPVKPTIVAGGIKAHSAKQLSMSVPTASDSNSTDSWDPWAQWNPSLGDATSRTQSTNQSDPSRVWSSKTSQSSRSSIQTSVSQSSEIVAIQVQLRDLAKTTKANQDSETKLRQDMQNEFTRVRAEMRTQIETSEQSVRATLDQRIHCIEKSLQETNLGMKEGFSAILAKLGHSGPDDSAKRAKQTEDMQIDPVT